MTLPHPTPPTPAPKQPAGLTLETLEALDDAALDRLDYGVIGFTPQCLIDRDNRTESAYSGRDQNEAMGHHLFEDVAQCMNNRLVAQRYADALSAGAALDLCIDHVFTFRMKPTPVRLRLLSSPNVRRRYLLVERV